MFIYYFRFQLANHLLAESIEIPESNSRNFDEVQN